MSNELNKYKNLKEVATDGVRQSTFLPILTRAEALIKQLIVEYFWQMKSKTELRLKIMGIIKATAKKIPNDLPNKDAYINGLSRSADKMITKYYDKAVMNFLMVSGAILRNTSQLGIRPPKVDTPQQLVKVLKENKKSLKIDMWAEQKGVPYIENYDKKVQEYVKNVTRSPVITYEQDKKGISLWQKAELDIRHEHQMEMLNDLQNKGVQYAWTSSHPNCSKRCEKWQAKLFDIRENIHSEMSGFRMKGKVDGNTVYCLNDVINQTDKYGYKNNIIVGFNCFDKETKVLTNDGWKLFSELEQDDLVYTLDPITKLTEWQKPIHYFKKFYNGEMMKLYSSSSDMLVTPNHQMLYYTQNNKQLRFEDAEKTKITHTQYAGQEWVGNNQKTIKVGNTEIESKVFCRFLGYWLADGSMHSKNGIKIAQTNNDEMYENLKELPYKLWRDDNKIVIHDKDLAELLRSLGTCETKYVFKWVKELSKECLDEFLNAYTFTDGYVSKPKEINGYMRKPHKQVFTTSKQMCADLCEIALKCGYRPKVDVRKNKGKVVEFKNGKYALNHDLFVIHLNYSTNINYKTIKRVNYSDYVYCVEVPNHTLLVMRNGCIQWCGNCRHHLIPYTPNSLPPKEFSATDIKKQRQIEQTIRDMEREIRFDKMQEIGNNITDKFEAKKLQDKIRNEIVVYKKYCESHGYAWKDYRININL